VTIILKGGHTTADPRLNRIPQFDPRSRSFPISELVAGRKPRGYTWSCRAWLDQGQEGACVGFAWAHDVAARPQARPADEITARSIYRRAQQLDEWPGEQYSGTSVLAGAKATMEFGHLTEYRWAFGGVDDLALAVGYQGPAVLGVNWYENMARTDAEGMIRVGGDVLGGHAILCNGVSVKKRLFRLRNSWGLNWGISGDCFIGFDDMDRLLAEAGEACIPVVRAG
jgi:hypothetical protein